MFVQKVISAFIFIAKSTSGHTVSHVRCMLYAQSTLAAHVVASFKQSRVLNYATYAT